MKPSSLSEMTWKRQPSWSLMILVLCESVLLVEGQAHAMESTISGRFEHVWELRPSENTVRVKRMATMVLRSCREHLSRALPRTAIW